MSSEVVLFLGLAQASSSRFTMKEIQLAFPTLPSGSWHFRGSPHLMQPSGRLKCSMELRRPQIPLPSSSRLRCACDSIFVLRLLSDTSGHSRFGCIPAVQESLSGLTMDPSLTTRAHDTYKYLLTFICIMCHQLPPSHWPHWHSFYPRPLLCPEAPAQ